MANTNNVNRIKTFAKAFVEAFAKNSPWRPVSLACALFFITGYFFYFAAYFLPTPQWGRDLMTWAMPMVKSLDSAARVGVIEGTDPFPAQVVILYGVWGAILLAMWCVYACTCNARLQQEILCYYQKVSHEKRPSMLGDFLSGMVLLLGVTFLFYVLFWLSATSNLRWQEVKFYSSSIDSVSIVLFAAVTMPGAVVVIFPMFYLSLFGHTSSEEN